MKLLLEFLDRNQGQMALFELHELGPESSMEKWICYKHPDGQYVTQRKATEEDLNVLGWRGRWGMTRRSELC